MKAVNSSALELLRKAYGLAGVGSGETELDDGRLDQVVDVNPVARRSMSDAGTSGMYTGLCLMTMPAGASSSAAVLSAYDVGTSNFPPWTTPIVDRLDIWLVGVGCAHVSGTVGNFTNASVSLYTPPEHLGFAINNTANSIARSGTNICLARWDVLNADTTALQEDGSSWQPVGKRLRRGEHYIFRCTATNAVVVELTVQLAVQPVALGQDVLA